MLSAQHIFNLYEFVDSLRAANNPANFFLLSALLSVCFTLLLSPCISPSSSLRVMTGFCLPLHWRWGRWVQWTKDHTLAWPYIPLWSHSTRNAPSASPCCLVRKHYRSNRTRPVALHTECRAVASSFLFPKNSLGFFVTVGKFNCQHPLSINKTFSVLFPLQSAAQMWPKGQLFTSSGAKLCRSSHLWKCETFKAIRFSTGLRFNLYAHKIRKKTDAVIKKGEDIYENTLDGKKGPK